MSMDERVAAFLNGESLAVEVEAIETELAQLWKNAAEKSLARAGAATLLVYSPHEGAYENAASALAALAPRYAGRLIAMVAAPEADENTLSAHISAHFHEAEGRRTGSEQITLFARGNTGDRLAETVTPLLVEKQPVVLWWQGELPEDDALFEKLLNASGYLIFDSSDGRDAGNTLSQARALSLSWKNGSAGDLNWLRLAPWRELIAKFMDSAPAAALRHQVAEVTLEVNAAAEGDAHFAKPFLLFGWLAGLLGWKLNEPLTPVPAEPATGNASVYRTAWQNKEKETAGKIILRQPEADADPAGAAGAMTSIQILFQPSAEPVVVAMQRNLATGQVTIRIRKGEQTLSESTAAFPEATVAELLAQEMASEGRDLAYESALRFATQLI